MPHITRTPNDEDVPPSGANDPEDFVPEDEKETFVDNGDWIPEISDVCSLDSPTAD